MQRSKYLVASERDQEWGLTVSTVGYEALQPFEPYPTRGHADGYYFKTERGRTLQEYQLLYITEGQGIFSSNHIKNATIKAGDVIILFPGEWHSYHPEAEVGWKSYWIGFRGYNIDARVKAGFLATEKPIYHVGQSVELTQLYENAMRVADEEQAYTQQMLAGIVNHLLGLVYSLERNLSLALQSNNVQSINKARLFIRENLESDINMQDIARLLGMSYSNFRRLFRELAGVSPTQYLQELRLQQACELVAYSNLSIKEIAFKLHFESPEYFATKFKRKTGCTPSQYRKDTRKYD